jgi:hypothetical protein
LFLPLDLPLTELKTVVEDPVHLHATVQVEMPPEDLREREEHQILVAAVMRLQKMLTVGDLVVAAGGDHGHVTFAFIRLTCFRSFIPFVFLFDLH